MWGYFSLHPFLFFIAISTTSRTSMVSSLDQCFQEISAFLASLSCWACCQILMRKFSLWTWCIRSRSPIEEYCKKRMFDLFIASLRTWHEPCMLSDVILAMGILVHIVILGCKKTGIFLFTFVRFSKIWWVADLKSELFLPYRENVRLVFLNFRARPNLTLCVNCHMGRLEGGGLPEFAEPRHQDHNDAQSLRKPFLHVNTESVNALLGTFASRMKRKKQLLSIL